jgi:hypothetical protein
MDSPCQNHGFLVRHKLRECELFKRFISKSPAKKAKSEDFPETTRCLMIISGTEAYGDKRRLKIAHHEVQGQEIIFKRF